MHFGAPVVPDEYMIYSGWLNGSGVKHSSVSPDPALNSSHEQLKPNRASIIHKKTLQHETVEVNLTPIYFKTVKTVSMADNRWICKVKDWRSMDGSGPRGRPPKDGGEKPMSSGNL